MIEVAVLLVTVTFWGDRSGARWNITYNHDNMIETITGEFSYSAVESPNNGHVEDMASVRSRELSASQRLIYLFIKTPNMHHLECSFTCIKVE